MDETREYIYKLEKEGYIDKKGRPLKCQKCEHTAFEYTDESYGPLGLEEYKLKCKNCDSIVGYWAYGNWQV